MNRPLVSVCIPTRDRAGWLQEALESVFRQSLQDFEVIVCDDGSTDETPTVVASWDDPRLRYSRWPRSAGVAATRNACLARASGRYVAWLDSDDRYHPDMLAVQAAALGRHPQAVLAHGGFEVIDESGERLPDWPPPFSRDVVEPGTEAFGELVLRNYITAPSVLVRRRAHEAAGPYRVSLRSGEDWEMWMRLALQGDLVYTARPVAQYRWHSGSLARRAESGCTQLRRDLRIVLGIFARRRRQIPDAARLESRARAALAVRALRQVTDHLVRRQRGLALAALMIAGRSRPALWRIGNPWRLLRTVGRLDEYGWHVSSRQVLGVLMAELEGTRMAGRLRKLATPDPVWEETLRRIARVVRDVVPRSATVSFVDKWDPTLLHLSRRRGWHYPDRRSMPAGYPPDSASAVAHLEEQRVRGADYLVFPCSAFWWLEHYPGLVRHLELSGERIWRDERCVIYRLLAGDPAIPETTERRWQAGSS